MKKVLRISHKQYLLKASNGYAKTTLTTDDALDLNELSWEQISYIFKSLHDLGFKDIKVLEVEK